MIDARKLNKGDMILNTLGQSCIVQWIGSEPTRRRIIGVDYGDGETCIGYEHAFFPYPKMDFEVAAQRARAGAPEEKR